MAHRIFTGTFTALEARLIDLMADEQAGDPLAPVAVLVGSNILAAYLKSRIAGRGRAAANLRFYTFLDLVAKLCSGSQAGRGKPRLPHLGASLLLADILETHAPEVFKTVHGFAGFRAALLDTFRDLRDAGITPDALEKSLPELKGMAPDRAKHLRGLSQLYRRFRLHVASFQDVAGDFQHASAVASAAGGILGTRSLLIYGIYDVTGIQAELLRSLRDELDLAYFIPYVNPAASHFAAPFLESRIAELNVTPVALPLQDRNDGLGILARHIFGPPQTRADAELRTPLAEDGSFALVSVPGESRTAVEVIREVLRAVRDGLIMGFYEAAVILRHPDEEMPILTEAFRLRSIPYYVHGGSAFGARPLSRAVLAVAALAPESFSRQAILTAMELVAAALPEEAASAWDVPQWRALTNDARFLAGIEAWDGGTAALLRDAHALCGRTEASAGSGAEDEEGEFHGISVMLARQRLESARSLRSGWLALRRAAADWPAALPGQDWAGLLEERLQPLLGTSRDWPAFSTVFDDLGMLGSVQAGAGYDGQISRSRMTAALSESLAALSHPEGRFQRRGINLLSAAAARGLRFPLVILPGLDEGRFPARLRQDPLLLDDERKQIGHPPRLPLKSLRGEEEKLLFDMALRSAEKRLVLMTSRLDESSDRERIPSDFFLRAAAAARGTASLSLTELTEENIPGLRSVSLDNPSPGRSPMAVDEGEIRLRLILGNPRSARPMLAALAQAEPLLLSGPMAFDRARWTRQLTEFDGRLLDPALISWTARKLNLEAGQISASRIEEYAKCPYYFYLRRVQELDKWEEPGPLEGMDPLERGKSIHEILETFVKSLAGGSIAAAQQEALVEAARRILEKARRAGMPDLLWEIELDQLLTMLRNWLVFEVERGGPAWRPAHLERSFGAFPGLVAGPGYRVQGPRHAFEFRGRIDRIDLSIDGRRARVIDYKTGKLPPTMAGSRKTPLMAGEKIQLATYYGALSVMEDLAGVESVEGEYLHLQPADGRIVPCSFGEEELRTAAARLPEMLEIIRDGMEGGVFFARSSGRVRPQGHCDYCEYLLI
ncbi:MAG: PD-(D/E)XK nuclease family protein, partial [Acidobacteriota bacterium]